MRAIPQVPIDGEQYVGLWQGVPAVLEYDGPTGGYKLVVTTETGVAINISGTVSLEAGDIAIGAVEIKNRDTDDRVVVSGLGQIYTHWPTGTHAIDDSIDIPTSSFFPNIVGVLAMAFNDVEGVYKRLQTIDFGGVSSFPGETRSLLGVTNFNMGLNVRVGSANTFEQWRTSTSADEIVGAQPAGEQLVIAKPYYFDRFASGGAGSYRRQQGDSEGRIYTSSLVTGSISSTPLASDLRIGAVEIQDADTAVRTQVGGLSDAIANPTGVFVGAFNMIYDIVGDNWDRDPARLVLDDGMAAGVFAQRISFGMHKDYAGSAWDANFGGDAISDGADAAMDLKNALNVRSILYAKNSGAQSFDRLIGPKERGLYVSMISGSFPGQSAAVEITDSILALQRAGLVGSLNLMYDVTGNTWERERARAPNDAMVAEIMPQRVSFGIHYNYDAGVQERHYGGDLSADNIGGGAGGASLDNAQNVRSVLLTNRGNFQYDTAYGRKESGLNVTMVSGTWPTDPLDVNILSGAGSILVTGSVVADTELAAATLFNDGESPPTTAPVWSFGMGYDINADEWDRIKIVALGPTITQTNLSPALGTAAVLYGSSDDVNVLLQARIDPATSGLIVQVTGTAIVDTELSAAVVAADGMANPTSPQVLSHLMGYNGVAWDRLYMGISGSLAVDLISQLDAVNDEVTAYVTGTLSVDLVTGSVIGIAGQTKIIQRTVVNISGTAAGANAEGLLVLGVSSERIKVLSLVIGGEAGFGATIKSGFSGSVIGLMEVNALANGPMTVVPPPPTSDGHWLETETGEDLVVQGDVAEWHAKGFMTYYTE